MPTALTLKAKEKGTYVLNLAFTDENGDPVTPVSAHWTLTDTKGNIIQDHVEITALAASKDVLLSDTDLVLSEVLHGTERVFLVEWTYNSTLGNGLPANDEAMFDIEGLVHVT